MGYSEEFAEFLSHYLSEILKQNGISDEQISLPKFYDAMTGKKSRFADSSVDSNANVASRSSAAVPRQFTRHKRRSSRCPQMRKLRNFIGNR